MDNIDNNYNDDSNTSEKKGSEIVTLMFVIIIG